MAGRQPQDVAMDLVKRSKLQSASAGLFLFSLLTMIMGWFKFSFLGESESFTFFEYAERSDVLVLVLTVLGLAASSFIIFLVKTNKVNHNTVVLASMAATAVSVLNILVGITSVLDNNVDEVDVSMGFYLFVLVNAAIASINGFKLMQNKSDVLKYANMAKAKVEEQTKSEAK